MPEFIEGNPALIVVDIMGTGRAEDDDGGIPTMGGEEERVDRVIPMIEAAKANGVPVIYIIEVHRPDHVDFGRELDGAETEHCVETHPNTRIHARLPYQHGADYLIPKRRYSAFFGTDLEILLKGLKANTLILCGGLTDVCVHYTFADAHQNDYYARVVEDCVGGSSFPAHDASLNAMEYLQRDARCSHTQVIEAFNARSRKAA
ncbi:MAG: cysteine hydrolase [Alphaproteobacteria bacterium]|jgi:biuret amidohydrolase|nr:cysteine hydrolase [Rhodospirillaceae bacterium]MBT6511641.1 cysteine hydrolase [Rhodospirillaceae bacterium]MBT7614313.1 cysteine hydrolase [Rhodospirillaceae bacterium]MBT7647366.1 cysteine hydrolase [Rhodospirillaceae bacterium]MDG2482394.1 cysteine hydrolase [Alphaproteobacteria bacterium]